MWSLKTIPLFLYSNYYVINSEFISPLQQGSILHLSKAITLVESTLMSHRSEAIALLKEIMPNTGKSIRIGISGVPGAGKSTFIDTFGKLLADCKYKIAILAIDPSSTIHKGSIMGDKTRMEQISNLENVYIRPSPTGAQLGGVQRATRESILLCEAAGFDIIIVETVGVGQNETTVKQLTDVFLLIGISGAGDELQGVKRGIMEIADIIAINKNDGDNMNSVMKTSEQIKSALHHFPISENGWIPRVVSCSALENKNIDDVWNIIQEYISHQKLNNSFEKKRNDQNRHWFEDGWKQLLVDQFFSSNKNKITSFLQSVLEGNMTLVEGIERVLNLNK
jgi:LAO/AO transport system kinase